MFDFNEYQRTIPFVPMGSSGMLWRMIPKIICADGFRMSVQATHTHYCSPREDECSYYSEVEVGFPSAKEETLMPYCENPNTPTDTVYGYVPVEIINAIVDAHGGRVEVTHLTTE
jgi:hypothetical protein